MKSEFKKDDCVTLHIEDIGTGGEGIGKADGFTFFVKDAIVGDVIEAKIMKLKKNYGYARLMKVLTPSKDRVEPKCPVARQCGGCQIQEMRYEAQLAFKQKMVQNNLERIGGLSDFEMYPVIGMETPYAYRNKAQFPVGEDKDGNIVIGFYAGRTHHIVEQTDCCIGAPENGEVLRKVRAYMQKNQIRPYNEEHHSGIVRHILIRTGYHTKEIMVCLIVNAAKASCLKNAEQLTESLREMDGMTSVMVNFNTEKTNVILGKKSEVLWGQPYIEDFIGDVKYQISPQSFFQVNPMQTEKLYAKALEYAGLTGNETVWDLYCGIGTISLFLAKNARKVYGVEIVPQAYEVQMPDVAEYYKEELLAFEKEILGVYVSGHPLDEYAAMWKRHISAMTTDFELDEETGELKAKDNTRVTIGGMIMDKTVKTTKNGQLMAFLTIEDLVGTVEVLVFPQSFNTYRSVIDTSDKVFVTGRVSANADENGKLICEKIVSFDSVPQKLWIRFANMAEYQEKQEELTKILAPSDGHDSVIIYCAEEKLKKQLPPSMNVKVEAGLVAQLREVFGTKNVETT